MTRHRSRNVFLPTVILALAATTAHAQESYKVEPLKEGPPAALAAAVKDTLASEGYRVLDDQGQPFAELWLRKAVPASGPPAGAQGAVLFPILAEGELLGAIRYSGEVGADYRDQPIADGVYTLRYSLQPINGDHLGVSPFRDFALLVPAAQDASTASLAGDALMKQSAEAAGTNHPAVLMLQEAPSPSPAGPTMVNDMEKQTWGVVVPLGLEVKGQEGPSTLPIQIVVVGAAMN